MDIQPAGEGRKRRTALGKFLGSDAEVAHVTFVFIPSALLSREVEK